MLHLGVVWDDTDYGPEAVTILHDMVRRNLPEGTEGTFTAFTDFHDDLGVMIDRRPLNAPRGDTVMFPLGCVIVRGLDALLTGEQVKSCFYDGSFPKEAAVVVFNDCRPQDCDNWVGHVWKIGGGTTAELKFIPNVAKSDLSDNIRSAIQRDCQWFEPREARDGIALIIGGGPSLKDDIRYIRVIANECAVFSLNGTRGYLKKHGIKTDFHVMLDAHPTCIDFAASEPGTTCLYASQCTPAVLDIAGDRLMGWHGGGDAMNAIANSENYTFMNVVGGGSTGATRAMILAYGLGYRKFHLFGLDSSYDGDVGHAYEQRDYENFLDVTCGDKVFKTSPQLLGQAEDFKMILPDLLQAACEVTVHGDGLLRAVATHMAA